MDPPAVLLHWEAQADGVSMTLQRRPFVPSGAQAWRDLASVEHTTTSWRDDDLALGDAVEYRLYRPWQLVFVQRINDFGPYVYVDC